jgi:hypothetical protein
LRIKESTETRQVFEVESSGRVYTVTADVPGTAVTVNRRPKQ